jgi:hypothetical protein
MSACARRRWGEGTPCTRDPATPAAKELTDKLAAMRAERERQDVFFGGGVGVGAPTAAPAAPAAPQPTDRAKGK